MTKKKPAARVPLISPDELERAAARLREPAAVHLAFIDRKGNVVQEWSGDVNQAKEMERTAKARGLKVRTRDVT